MSAGIFRMRREAAEQAAAEQAAADAAQAEQACPMPSTRVGEPAAEQPGPLNKGTAATVAKSKPQAPSRAT